MPGATNKMKNPLWKIKEENNEYLMMYCETDTICKLCPVSYQKILDFEKDKNDDKKLTFFKNATNYTEIEKLIHIFFKF